MTKHRAAIEVDVLAFGALVAHLVAASSSAVLLVGSPQRMFRTMRAVVLHDHRRGIAASVA